MLSTRMRHGDDGANVIVTSREEISWAEFYLASDASATIAVATLAIDVGDERWIRPGSEHCWLTGAS